MYEIYEMELMGLVLPQEIIDEYKFDEVTHLMVPWNLRDPLSFDRYGEHPAPLEAISGFGPDGGAQWQSVVWPIGATVHSYEMETVGQRMTWRLGQQWSDWPFYMVMGYDPEILYHGMLPEDVEQDARAIRVWAGWPITPEQFDRLNDEIQAAFEGSAWLSLDRICDMECQEGITLERERARARRDPAFCESQMRFFDPNTGESHVTNYFEDFSRLEDWEVGEAQTNLEELTDLLSGLEKTECGDYLIQMSDFPLKLSDDLAEYWLRLQYMRDGCLQALIDQHGYTGIELEREREMSEWF